MKRIVWGNKSNKQLCITIPKNSGINDGDIVSIEKTKINTIVYTSITADLFHYGNLRILETASKLGDMHICGVLTDNAIKLYRGNPISNFKERHAIVSSLRCVDMVMTQKNLDPTDNLKEIQTNFNPAKIIIIYGSNWKTIPGEKFIKANNIDIIQPLFYEKLSLENIFKKLEKIYKNSGE